MMTAWVTYSAVVGVLVAAAALLLHTLRKGSGAPLRWIWAAAMLLTIVLTVSAPWRGQTQHVSLDLTRATEVRNAAVQGQPLTMWDRAQRLSAQTLETMMVPIRMGVTVASRAPRIVNYSALLLSAVSCSVALQIGRASCRERVLQVV